MRAYYAFRVRCRSEHTVRAELQEMGLWATVPMATYTCRPSNGRTRSGAREVRQAPAAPGYVFVALPRTHNALRQVLSCDKVWSVVTFNGEPAAIGCGAFHAFTRRAVQPPKKRSLAEVVRGQVVQVLDGPFTSHRGMVGASDDEGLEVLVSLFGKVTSMRMDYDKVGLVEANGIRRLAA